MKTRMPLSKLSRALATFAAICVCASRGAAQPSPSYWPAASANIPPTVQITCPRPWALSVFASLPSLRIVWEGHDPDGPGTGTPVKYKYILLSSSSEFPFDLALVYPDSLRRFYAQRQWAGWDSTGGANPSASYLNLIPNGHYVFVVIAFDQAGAYTPAFTLTSNMLHFVVTFSTGYLGPVITMTGPGLNYTYPTGGYCPCPSAEVPAEIPEHAPATFHWSATAVTPCDHQALRFYRWALDIDDVYDQTPRVNEQTDLKHWSAASITTTSTMLPAFSLSNPPTPETHRLYIEAGDDLGLKSLGIILITVVLSANRPPDCRAAAADPRVLWPPNHRLVRVNITGVNDPDGDPVAIGVTRVTQDEPIGDHGWDDHIAVSGGRGDGADDDAVAVGDMGHFGDDHGGGSHGDDRRACADAVIDPDGGLRLRAERDGRGNGRVYTVWFTASDAHGGSCDGSVQVCVPRDHAHPTCVDGGGSFNYLGPCGGHRHGDDSRTMLEVSPGSGARGTVATLDYSLPVSGDVLVAVFDVSGRRVTTLVNEAQAAGAHQAIWDHSGAAQGMYFVRLVTRSASMTRPMLVLK